MDIQTVNKILADACGVYSTDYGWVCDEAKKAGNGKFRIEECECREIIREKFRITTRAMATGGWLATYYYDSEFGIASKNVEGKTIAESEKACITAICKQMESDDE